MLNLEFVPPEEAAKWPDGSTVVMCGETANPKCRAETFWLGKISTKYATEDGYTHYLRLPDSLPEVERNETD